MGYKWRYFGIWQWIFRVKTESMPSESSILEEYLNEPKMMELPQSSEKTILSCSRQSSVL